MHLIIVAGGKGLRMGAPLPKQFLPINGRPIIMHTIERFAEAMPGINIVLVLHPDYVDLWRNLCTKHKFDYPCTITTGGKERFDSVRNGLAVISDNSQDAVVGVHDAVRPLVSAEVIRNAYAEASELGAVVPALPSIESVRIMNDDGTSQSIARHKVMMVQTPQVFSLPLLREAYNQPYCPDFTDDASVVEAYGHAISIVDGNRENIKLTTPQDMHIAEILLK